MILGRGLFKSAAAPPPAAAERRRSVRHITVLQVAKLRSPAGEELCLLRDVSEGGLKAEIYGPLEAGEAVSIELRTGHSVAGRVAWVERPMMGVEFPAPVPILSMLAHCAFDERLTTLRPPRIDVDMPAMLDIYGETLAVRITNLSQAGLGIRTSEPLESDAACLIRLPALPPRGACIRWSHDSESGLQLDQAMTYREFAAWRTVVPAALADGGAASAA